MTQRITRHISTWLLFSVSTIATWSAANSGARADLGACGDIDVQAKAQCEVVPPGVTCEGKCTPVTVRAACAGQLAVDCRAHCNKLPTVSCQGSCEGSCMADCDKVNPGTFDCRGSCQVDCSGRCAANCNASGNQASCEASCKGSCAASCDASCTATPPQVDCKASCQASCKGSCEVDPNVDCQASCQAQGEVKCEADLEGGCKAQCKKHDGALFCDGQYVDNGDNFKECVDSLRAVLNAHVTATAEGSSSCDDAGTCGAQGNASISSKGTNCAVAAPGARRVSGLWMLLGLAGIVLARRRARARRSAH